MLDFNFIRLISITCRVFLVCVFDVVAKNSHLSLSLINRNQSQRRSSGMANAALALGTVAGYEKTGGYGSEAGQQPLRDLIAEALTARRSKINASEIFVSDGSKCDISRMQQMFGPGRKVAVQDPAYPAYVDSSVINGKCTWATTKKRNDTKTSSTWSACRATTFFQTWKLRRTRTSSSCSPNNPTGAAATRAQCKDLVDFANKNGQIVIYDAAYAFYIENPDCPKTIYEIEGSETCCIESCSFSKYAGFTGLRLGWTVVPEALKFADGSSVRFDWNRCMCTAFQRCLQRRARRRLGGVVRRRVEVYARNGRFLQGKCENVEEDVRRVGF